MAYQKPWDEPDLTSHGSWYAIKKISELLIGADKYAMMCSQRNLDGQPIYRELKMWFNTLNRTYINAKPLIENTAEKNDIESAKKAFEKYFKELNTPPSRRTIKSDQRLEKNCMDDLDKMQEGIVMALQKHYNFFYRFGELGPTRGLPQASEDLIKQLERRGYVVAKKDDKHDKIHKE